MATNYIYRICKDLLFLSTEKVIPILEEISAKGFFDISLMRALYLRETMRALYLRETIDYDYSIQHDFSAGFYKQVRQIFDEARLKFEFWTLGLPEGVLINRICPPFCVCPSISVFVFKYLRYRSLVFSETLHEFWVSTVKKAS